MKIILNILTFAQPYKIKAVLNIFFVLKWNICRPKSQSSHAFIFLQKSFWIESDVKPKRGYPFFIKKKIHNSHGMKNIIIKYKMENY